MTRSTDIRLTDIITSTEEIGYRTPIKFGGRVVNDVVLFHVRVEVTTRTGERAVGRGSMPVGNVWAWPSQSVSTEQSLAAMIQMSERMAQAAARCSTAAHPLEICHELATGHAAIAAEVQRDAGIDEDIPKLAQLVSVSPLEAAIFDAHGKPNRRNSSILLAREFVNCDLQTYLGDEFSGEYLDDYTSRSPMKRLPIYHLVAALDAFSGGDIDQRVDDGLPETLGEWIKADGLTHLKIKLAGDDLLWDVERVVAVEQVAIEAQTQRGCTRWCYSLDFNEKCANVQYVLDFLAKLTERSPTALERVQYIEQPTHRDLRANPENKMHEAARIKPIVIDESLVDLESLLLAREHGYSGVALKACKGHSEALLMGAAAQKYGLFLCVQDLTCVGSSFLHSASIAARIPTVAAIEGNGRQYCPAGNQPWESKFPGMFQITDGTVETAELIGRGLGF